LKCAVFLFPGQGAQYTGMAMDLIESDAVKSLFDTASNAIGKDIKKLLQSDTDTLKRTDISQPAITAANLAAAAYLGEKGFSPAVCAGFSLGEYAALVCAGVLNAADCFRLVKARGEIMQKAADLLCAKSGSGADGVSDAPGMAAVVGLSPDQAEKLIAKWSEEGCYPSDSLKDLYAANINSPKQLVISGTAAALSQAEIRFKEAGAKRVIRLQVAGPFHSPLMAEAAREFTSVLEEAVFRDPMIPVFSNVTGKRITSGEEAKKLASLHITHPVRWVEEEAAIAAFGVEVCFEAGPGRVLQGLWKDSGNTAPVFAAGTAQDISILGENV